MLKLRIFEVNGVVGVGGMRSSRLRDERSNILPQH